MAQGEVAQQASNGSAVDAGAATKASGATAPWLNTDMFLVPEFDPDASISDLRRYVSAPRISFDPMPLRDRPAARQGGRAGRRGSRPPVGSSCLTASCCLRRCTHHL